MRFMKLLLLVALLAFGARGVYAQFETASIVGKVTDSTGAVIPGATVTVTNTETGVAITRQTNDSGEYTVPALRNGIYRVVVNKDGFDNFAVDNVNLAIGTNQRVDASLKIGAENNTVTVEASDLVLETETTQRQQVITTEQIEAFPVLNLNYSDLVTLSAGAMAAPTSEDLGTTSMTREGSFNINGQRSTFNNYLLDGMDNNAHGTSNQGFSNQIINPPYSSISQFSIVTTLPSAEYGRSSGGTINTAFKQGTNKFHGQVYEYFRNTIFNTNGYFKPAAGSDAGSRTTLNRNQFGGNFGMPIKHDKFFVFGDYEGFRQVRTQVNQTNTFTAAQHQYITSANTSVNTLVINPFTAATYPSQRPLPANVISPIAAAIMNDIPLPNNYVNGYNSISANWVYLQRFVDSLDKEDVRLDAQWTPRMSSFLRVSQSKEHALDGPSLPLPLEGGKNGYIRVINQQVALGLTRQIGASQLLEARVGLSFTKGNKNPYTLGSPVTYGIKGLPTDPRVWGGLTSIDVGDVGAFGRQSTNPQWQYPAFFNPKVSYSWLMGHHNLKVGYEFGYMRQSVEDVNPIYGAMSFNTGFSYNAYSDFWLGAPDTLSMTTFYIAHIRQGGHAGYFQDDWKILPKVTLNLGVRYEYTSHFYEKDNRLTNFDPNTTPYTGQLIRATDGSPYKKQLIDPDYNDFMPRLGISYAPISKLVIHGGYGIGYVHYTRSGEVDNLAVNGPQVNIRVLQQAPKYFTATLEDQKLQPTSTFYSLDDGYPAGMASLSSFDIYTSRVAYVPRNYKDPYVQSWYLGIQASVGKNRLVDIAYVGNHSLKLQQVAVLNQRNPDLGVVDVGPDRGKFARPYANIGDVTMSYNNGLANYNGLQAKFEQRNFHGITFLNSFTWSREFENVSGPLESTYGHSASSTDIYAQQHKDYGPGNFDRPILDIASLVWTLPVGRGKSFFKHAGTITNALVGGWQIGAINTYYDGAALSPNSNLSTNLQTLSDTGSVQYRPYFINNTPYGRRVAHKRIYQPYFPEKMYCNSSYSSPTNSLYSGCTVQFNPRKPGAVVGDDAYNDPRGDTPNGFLRGPSRDQLDLSINKSFNLPWNKMKFQIRGQLYNALNKTNFTTPGMSCCGASFGRVSNTYQQRIGQVVGKIIW